QKRQSRQNRSTLKSWSEEYIRGMVSQNRITSEKADSWIYLRNLSDDRFERELEEEYPSGKVYREPHYWDDARFSNPSQPVVGVTWFEARAYCNWLTANARGDSAKKDWLFRLPTEVEFEAAVTGVTSRTFAYGVKFDSKRCNVFASHIRRTTPVGIFNNATPEGTLD